MAVTPNTITIGEVRFSYTHLFQPYAQQQAAEPKYSTTILVPKTDAASKAAIDAAVNAAIEQGVNKCWNGVRPPQPSICVHDGDGPRPSDGQPFGAECRGHWVFTASSKNAPFVVDTNVQNIINQADVYSGMYGCVNVSFFPYANSGKKGIGCGLNGVQKTRDGEPLGSHVSVEEAFGAPVSQPPMQYQPPVNAQPQYQPPMGYPAPNYGQAYSGAINPITGQPM